MKGVLLLGLLRLAAAAGLIACFGAGAILSAAAIGWGGLAVFVLWGGKPQRKGNLSSDFGACRPFGPRPSGETQRRSTG